MVDRSLQSGSPPLHYAASFGHVASINKLLEVGANVNAVDAVREYVIFLFTVSFVLRRGSLWLVVDRCLIRWRQFARPADLTVVIMCAQDGASALLHAMEEGKLLAVQILVSMGASVNHRTDVSG